MYCIVSHDSNCPFSFVLCKAFGYFKSARYNCKYNMYYYYVYHHYNIIIEGWYDLAVQPTLLFYVGSH